MRPKFFSEWQFQAGWRQRSMLDGLRTDRIADTHWTRMPSELHSQVFQSLQGTLPCQRFRQQDTWRKIQMQRLACPGHSPVRIPQTVFRILNKMQTTSFKRLGMLHGHWYSNVQGSRLDAHRFVRGPWGVAWPGGLSSTPAGRRGIS